MDGTLGALTGAFITLVFGYLGFQLTLGGRRRRLRRTLGEELDLLAKIGPSPERERLEARVQRLLEAYEPDPSAKPTLRFERKPSTVVADIAIGIGAVGIAIDLAITADSYWISLAAGAAAGVVVSVLGIVRGATPVYDRPNS